VSDALEKLRKAGWSVAVHNDYRLNGWPHTFWLFTHPSGWWAKGEGLSDAEATHKAWKQARERPTGAERQGRETFRKELGRLL